MAPLDGGAPSRLASIARRRAELGAELGEREPPAPDDRRAVSTHGRGRGAERPPDERPPVRVAAAFARRADRAAVVGVLVAAGTEAFARFGGRAAAGAHERGAAVGASRFHGERFTQNGENGQQWCKSPPRHERS